MARLITAMEVVQRDPDGLVKLLSELENPAPASVIRKHASDKPYRDSSYNQLQIAGFMARHGLVVSTAGDTDVPEDEQTSGSRSDDLSSPGTIRNTPVDAARRQTSQTGKALKKSAAQKCHACGSMWIGHKASCESCGAAMGEQNTMIKACKHGDTSKLVDGGVRCNGCNTVWPDEQSYRDEKDRQRAAGDSDATDTAMAIAAGKSHSSNQPRHAQLSKSAQALSHHKINESTSRPTDPAGELRKMLNESANPELARLLLCKTLERKAAENPAKGAEYLALAQIADALDLSARGPVRLGTGRRGGGGRHSGWIGRHF